MVRRNNGGRTGFPTMGYARAAYPRQAFPVNAQPEREGSDAPLNGGYPEGTGRILRHLEELDFALQETALYLDAYPNSGDAMSYYRRLLEERAAVAASYAESGGVLTNRDATVGGNGWSWVKNPWPWEASFPGNCPCAANGREE